MLFDQATISIKAGDGGDGCLSFRREKYVPFGGPDGGHGGRGGNVYLRVSDHLNTLMPFNRKRHFAAAHGAPGQGQRMKGAAGNDLYIDVPRGTVVSDAGTGQVLADLSVSGQQVLVARGGRGGRGNEAFKTSSRHTPRFAEKGAPGQERRLTLELKLIADVGLLGKPNAGKSTLLARVSAARPKIADYPFTTLDPSLGVVEIDQHTFVMADIPGLIEGAHMGTGLGLQFLRHVERTRLLVHLLDGASLDPAEDYRKINYEISQYSARLAEKPQLLVLTKADLPDSRLLLDLIREELGIEDIYHISAVTGEGVTPLLRAIASRLDELPQEEPADDLFVFRPLEDQEDRSYTITQISSDTYRLAGEEIERLAAMTDWNNDEAVDRFDRILAARGITREMDEMGVESGCTVVIGSVELEWQ
ncbi:MAG: GTPase ObgE [Chloroflexi bacterium]|nr:GTPase ObgE [Chloroflexota bacterium]